MSFMSLQTSVTHENSQVSAGGQEEVGLVFGSTRASFSRLTVLPDCESFTSCALPPSLELTGMYLCSLRNILDVGAEGTVQGGDVGAFGTVVQKDVGAFATVDQKDVVAEGTVRKSVSAVSYQSSVFSPGLKVSDPMLEVGDGRCAGDIPPSPGCAASRPHEHTRGSTVPPGTVSDPEVKKRPPRYNLCPSASFVNFFCRSKFQLFSLNNSPRIQMPHNLRINLGGGFSIVPASGR